LGIDVREIVEGEGSVLEVGDEVVVGKEREGEGAAGEGGDGAFGGEVPEDEIAVLKFDQGAGEV
jgi:hypothetical protein